MTLFQTAGALALQQYLYICLRENEPFVKLGRGQRLTQLCPPVGKQTLLSILCFMGIFKRGFEIKTENLLPNILLIKGLDTTSYFLSLQLSTLHTLGWTIEIEVQQCKDQSTVSSGTCAKMD